MMTLYKNYFNNISKERLWKVGIYARISREDEKDENYKGQSESIDNQINFIKPLIERNNWILIDIYKDDGYTGTNFERPDFSRMLGDIELGKINLIITKDLSRLGRDYIEVGRFVERYFPKKGIRYIAVNDNVDTFDKNNTNNDMTPFKAVFNDMYAKDISKKVRTSITTKATRGECIKAFMPYGYKKDAKDKNIILIDEAVSENIKNIFELYKNGKGKKEIANILNDEKIITPLKYKELTTNYYNPNANATYEWNSTVINKILRDRTYIGDLVQLKYSKVNYKIKKVEKVSKGDYIIVENNHKAIIDRKTFFKVQEMLDKQSNEWNYSNNSQHLLTGLVFCKCGSRITYNKNHGKYVRCICCGYKKFGKKFCTNVHIREDELILKVITSLKNNIKMYFNISDVKYEQEQQKNDYSKDILKLNKMIEQTHQAIRTLYDDKISGQISNDTFGMLMQNYEKQKKKYKNEIQEYKNKEISSNEMNNMDRNEFEESMNKVLRFTEINQNSKSLIFKLIDRITIDDKDITIKYKFNIK